MRFHCCLIAFYNYIISVRYNIPLFGIERASSLYSLTYSYYSKIYYILQEAYGFRLLSKAFYRLLNVSRHFTCVCKSYIARIIAIKICGVLGQ